jgi:hypothetical protein
MASSYHCLLHLNTTKKVAIAFFTTTTPQKKTMAHCHHLLHLYNNTIEKDDDNVASSSSSQTQRRQNTQENNKKKPREGRELTFKLLLCPLTFGSHFCPPTIAHLFQTLSFGIFLFSSRKKTKIIEEKKM